jgi:alkanesulfonate monooxygenase SsuD/methylene tetrahydromethanopterin reductase-like flavin-dependent oxidoreductase (luciferase family)
LSFLRSCIERNGGTSRAQAHAFGALLNLGYNGPARHAAPAPPWPEEIVATRQQIGIDVKQEGREYGLTSRDIVELGGMAEQAGFESLWTNEDIGYDSLAVLSAASQKTSAILLGTAIVNVYTRSALQLAMGVGTLDELSGGRAILGLSVGHHPWNDLGHGIPLEAPVARLREYVAFLRKALSGDAFRHDGRFFQGVDTQLHFAPHRPSLPIHIAGGGPQMIKLAGEVSDGLIVNILSAESIQDDVAPRFRAAARDAGRNPDDLEITALVTCCVSDDREEALAQARSTFIYRIRRGLRMLEHQPERYHQEIRYLYGLIQDGKADQAAREASEPLVSTVMNAGNADDVWAGIQRYFSAGCKRVVAVAYPRGRRDVERMIAALKPKLAAASVPA